MSTLEDYDSVTVVARHIIEEKDHDYGEAWREMRPTSITDQILVKVRRMKRLEDLAMQGKEPKVAEGILSELYDILNYAAFEIILLRERDRIDAFNNWVM